jgi:2-phosphosulfolactate phosphatase
VRIDVFFGGNAVAPSDLNRRVVLVIDVLRASTSIAVALTNGARTIIPFESAEEAITRSKSFERGDVRLAGERKMLPIPGFDLGNSPRQFSRDAVDGKTILLTTTNGTGTLLNTQGSRDVLIGCYVNYTAVLAMLRAATRVDTDITIICAGREKQFALEDAACAGRFVRGMSRRGARTDLNDAATAAVLLDKRYGDDVAALFHASVHGRALAEAGFAEDLAVCGDIDAFPVVPVYQERQITRFGAVRER